MSDINQTILQHIPQQSPFRFVDEITAISEDRVEGTYFFPANADFYRGHFPGDPITPGVILTECMGQIGLVALGIYLLRDQPEKAGLRLVLAGAEVQFLAPVYPDTQVRVVSEKQYFRLGKLKAQAQLWDSTGQLCCKGILSGVMVPVST